VHHDINEATLRAYSGESMKGEKVAEVRAYLAKWEPLLDQLRALGFEIVSFDPGICVRPASGEDGVVTLPMWAVSLILKKGTEGAPSDPHAS
jgi:hypothetical protein